MAVSERELSEILRQAERAVGEAHALQELVEVRARFLGRKGSLSSILRGLGGLGAEERARLGQAANQVKARIEELVAARRQGLEAAGRSRALAEGRLDVTLPGAEPPRGRLHPITRMEREMCAFFQGLGYAVEDGPEVDTDYHNFGALNFPDDHPARDTQDTFFVEGGHVLRTHTSNVQIRAMSGRRPPFRFVAPGRVYRHDFDATHSPMFHQIEGVCVSEDVSFAELKGTLYAFARHMLGDDVEVRFRAHYFPFTEPSAEMDARWGERGWLELLGCGMIHPAVLANCGIDPERWQGFAFGTTIDRLAMLRFGIPNIHLMFDGDVRVLEQL